MCRDHGEPHETASIVTDRIVVIGCLARRSFYGPFRCYSSALQMSPSILRRGASKQFGRLSGRLSSATAAKLPTVTLEGSKRIWGDIHALLRSHNAALRFLYDLDGKWLDLAHVSCCGYKVRIVMFAM